MKTKKPSTLTNTRMLPPLDTITLERWAEICEIVDAKYRPMNEGNLQTLIDDVEEGDKGK